MLACAEVADSWRLKEPRMDAASCDASAVRRRLFVVVLAQSLGNKFVHFQFFVSFQSVSV